MPRFEEGLHLDGGKGGGVNIGGQANIGGDAVGGDKIVGHREGLSEELLLVDVESELASKIGEKLAKKVIAIYPQKCLGDLYYSIDTPTLVRELAIDETTARVIKKAAKDLITGN